MSDVPGNFPAADRLDLVDAVIYADLFDAAVTLDDVHHFARIQLDRSTLERAFANDPVLGEIVERTPSGAFTLRGRSGLGVANAKTAAHAEQLGRRAVRVGRVLRHAPFVRGVALTGSAAAGTAPPGADVDLLVIVARNRIGTVFALLGSLSRLLGRRAFCPNYYVSEGCLASDREDVYVGHEIGQARAVLGDAGVVRRANRWVERMFPNLSQPQPAPIAAGGIVQRLLEAPLSGRLGHALEQRARQLARARLNAHYGGSVPEDITRRLECGETLRFHASGVEHSVPRRYEELRATVGTRLQRAEQRIRTEPTALP